VKRGFIPVASGAIPMTPIRRAGILLHPTSLPGPFGIGDLGPQAYRWVDFLAEAGVTIWQILPLGPTGYGDSPYQSYSAFAGNGTLISPEKLAAEGLISEGEAGDHAVFPAGSADFAGAEEFKRRLISVAYHRSITGENPGLQKEFAQFRAAEVGWLEDYALFIALKRAHGEQPWWEWEPALKAFQPDAANAARAELSGRIDETAFGQFLFQRQWDALRRYAREKGILLLGDLPIFPALDSADVWTRRKYFSIDEAGNPAEMAGVPPDYFSPTGQLWGNPVFRWDVLRAEGYAWWIARAQAALRRCDRVRLDHFRGYARYWSVPAGSITAEVGSWRTGPGEELFERARSALGGMPFLAEDLGVITDDVVALRLRFDLPGMRVLQFAFGDDFQNPFLPHNFDPHTAVYTGTHDNDTTLGWFGSLEESERARVRRYLGRSGDDIAWDFIRMAMASVAETAICPLQDVLALGGEARMNFPGRATGNWTWRLREDDLRPELARRLRELITVYGRLPEGLDLNGTAAGGIPSRPAPVSAEGIH
jgi:4-alpha-glucanotransferase